MFPLALRALLEDIIKLSFSSSSWILGKNCKTDPKIPMKTQETQNGQKNLF